MQKKIQAVSTEKFGKNGDENITIKDGGIVETDGTTVVCGTEIKISKNYNSVGISCQVHYPTTRKGAEIAAKKAWKFVDDQLEERMAEANKFLTNL